MDLDDTWHAWRTQGPLQILFFDKIRADPGWAKIGHGVHLRLEGYSNKPNA